MYLMLILVQVDPLVYTTHTRVTNNSRKSFSFLESALRYYRFSSERKYPEKGIESWRITQSFALYWRDVIDVVWKEFLP